MAANEAAEAAEAAEAPEPSWFLVGKRQEFKTEGSRIHFQVAGRSISVLNDKGQLYCIDSICFHGGGPLTLGDIEEVGGRTCITCPWHRYHIALDNGDKLYDSLAKDPKTGRLVQGGWKAMPMLQRTHMVREGKDGSVFVLLDPGKGGELRSDAYAYDQRAAEASFTNMRHINQPCAEPPT